MAAQITAWKSVDGTLHGDEHGARVADSKARIDRLSSELAEEVKPHYGDADEIKRALIGNGRALVLELAAAITALRALETPRNDELWEDDAGRIVKVVCAHADGRVFWSQVVPEGLPYASATCAEREFAAKFRRVAQEIQPKDYR